MDDLVTRALLSALTPDDSQSLSDLPAETWRALLDAAQQHRIAPLVAHRLTQKGFALPNEVAHAFQRASRDNARRNAILYHALAPLLEQFRAENIPVLALKGIHLAAQVYDDPRVRAMGDIDLLISPNELQHAEAILMRAGATPFNINRIVAGDNYHFLYAFAETAFIVEIHWSLYPATTAFRLDEAGLWQRACPVTLGRQTACVLSTEDLILHLCIHAAKETYEMNLRVVCDLDAVVRKNRNEIDWQTVAERARLSNALKPTYLFLRLTRELLHSPIPPETLTALEPPRWDESYYLLARTQLLAGETKRAGKVLESPYLTRVLSQSSPGEKLRLIWTRLLPSRRNLALLYPASADSWKIFLYYFVRAKDITVKFAPYLCGMVFGNSQARAITERTNDAARLGEWLTEL